MEMEKYVPGHSSIWIITDNPAPKFKLLVKSVLLCQAGWDCLNSKFLALSQMAHFNCTCIHPDLL